MLQCQAGYKAYYIPVTSCDNSRRLVHYYSHCIDEERDLVRGLSKLHALVFTLTGEAVTWILSGGMWRMLLAFVARPMTVSYGTHVQSDNLLPGCHLHPAPPPSPLVHPRLCSGPFLSARVAFPFPVESWSLSPSGADLPVINTI